MNEDKTAPTTPDEGEKMTLEEAREYGYFEETANTLQEVIEASEGVDANGKAR